MVIAASGNITLIKSTVNRVHSAASAGIVCIMWSLSSICNLFECISLSVEGAMQSHRWWSTLLSSDQLMLSMKFVHQNVRESFFFCWKHAPPLFVHIILHRLRRYSSLAEKKKHLRKNTHFNESFYVIFDFISFFLFSFLAFPKNALNAVFTPRSLHRKQQSATTMPPLCLRVHCLCVCACACVWTWEITFLLRERASAHVLINYTRRVCAYMRLCITRRRMHYISRLIIVTSVCACDEIGRHRSMCLIQRLGCVSPEYESYICNEKKNIECFLVAMLISFAVVRAFHAAHLTIIFAVFFYVSAQNRC